MAKRFHQELFADMDPPAIAGIPGPVPEHFFRCKEIWGVSCMNKNMNGKREDYILYLEIRNRGG
jgi:hypothetical protein